MAHARQPPAEWQLIPFYLGAAIGPTGGGVFAVLFTILLGAFDVDRSLLSLAVPAYMVPYAAVQLVSGGLSDLTSRRASILLGFGSYGAASLVAALAPTFPVFLLSQVLQGASNAFTTPILLATLGDVLPRERVGRSMGLFSSTNQAGALAAPLLAGALGDLNWRLVYLVITGISWGLLLWYVLWFRRYGALVPTRVRANNLPATLRTMARAVGLPVVLLASLSFLTNGAMRGPSYLFAEYLRDTWGTSVGQAGLLLSTYGLAALVGGPGAGWLVDRVGPIRGIAGGMLGVAASLVLMGWAPSPLLFAAANFTLGLAGIVAWAGLNTLAVRTVPERRGTVASIAGSARFLGQAVAPLWFTPLYDAGMPASLFLLSAAMAVAALAPLAKLRALAPEQERAAAPASARR